MPVRLCPGAGEALISIRGDAEGLFKDLLEKDGLGGEKSPERAIKPPV